MHHYPFHIGDYVAHTRHLLPIEDLAYRRLLDAYYLREGPLPSDVATTARLIGLRGHEAEVGVVLEEFFSDTDEGWRHSRCDEEIVRYQAMVSGGRKGAATRWAKGGDSPPMARAKGGDRGGITPPNGNQNQNQNQEPIPPKPPRGPDLFEEFWSAFPRKVGRDAAAKAFEKRKPERAVLDAMLAALAQQKKSPQWVKDGGEFIPHPATWLNQGRWQDEVAAPLSAFDARTAGWSSYALATARRLFPDGNIPAGYVPSGSPAGG